jgi:hypothetical protein
VGLFYFSLSTQHFPKAEVEYVSNGQNHNWCELRFCRSKRRFWVLQLLDKVSPSQWAAIGVLASVLFGLLTYLTNLYFKIKEDRRKAARVSDGKQGKA